MSLPVQATMEALMSLGLHKQAEQLYKDFRVPDKRWVDLMSLRRLSLGLSLLDGLSSKWKFQFWIPKGKNKSPHRKCSLERNISHLSVKHYLVLPVQVLVAEAQVYGREGGVGGVREILQKQEVSHWLPCETPPLYFQHTCCTANYFSLEPLLLLSFRPLLRFAWRTTTGMKPRNTSLRSHLSRRSKLTWPWGKTALWHHPTA